ncbi:hypothetical protein [Prauserella endophytica]|uniref:Secreted protein n=1 Tax=Prauserella endophytica TaxID=1592324 RepID=A0ABY2SDH7_9PSEU|nr:hypothetical protein [Prauserella endophytica]TKG73667.1 hypothetical protein FCN18_03695 [Prauserella endophytica]
MKQRRRRSAALSAIIGLALTFPAAMADADETVSWTLDPAPGPVARATTDPLGLGVTDHPVEHLDVGVNSVTTTAPGPGAAVDVRGLRADGTWSEWIEIGESAPAVLPERTTSVQARVVTTAGGEPKPVTLTAWHDASAEAGDTAHGTTFRIFATREGLVGGTTANGHVITERDHFVALPSRRGLATRGGGDYTVKVCTIGNQRCEWAPVWDVGPWNTKDDHWNPGRESWRDLPHGVPQAQAAYQDGYNGGRDQFGRKVKNPAGIDLADGTFWDGLRLADNAWVNVTYQWTGHGPWGTVEAPWALNVRTGPSLSAPQVGFAAPAARVRIECVAVGQWQAGSQGHSNRWYRLAPGMYVSAAHIREALPAPMC